MADYDATQSSPHMEQVMKNPLSLAAALSSGGTGKPNPASDEEGRAPARLSWADEVNQTLPSGMLGGVSPGAPSKSPGDVNRVSSDLSNYESATDTKSDTHATAYPAKREANLTGELVLSPPSQVDPTTKKEKTEPLQVSEGEQPTKSLEAAPVTPAPTAPTKAVAKLGEGITKPPTSREKIAAKEGVTPKKHKPKVSMSSWLSSIASSSKAAEEPEPIQTAQELSFSDEEEEVVTPASPSGSKLKVKVPSHGELLSDDLMAAISVLSRQVVALTDRLSRHERECTTEHETLLHRAEGTWSESGKGKKKAVLPSSSTQVEVEVAKSTAVAALKSITAKLPVEETVKSVTRRYIRQCSTLGGPSLLAKAQAMMLELGAADDAESYPNLPSSPDQAAKVIKTSPLAAAINLML